MILLPRLEHVAMVHLGEPPSLSWLAVCHSLPASILQAQSCKHLSLTHHEFISLSDLPSSCLITCILAETERFLYLDLSAKVSLELFHPVPGELLLPFLSF
jgi:hypothetical protein